MCYLEMASSNVQEAEQALNKPRKLLGQLKATAIAGNGLAGGVFYTFPAVIAVAGDVRPNDFRYALNKQYAGTYAPICLVFSAALLLFLRPILLELSSAVRLNGAYVATS